MPIYLPAVYGCFLATVTELSSCERNHMSQKPKMLSGPLYKMFADSYKVIKSQTGHVFCPSVGKSEARL